MSITLRTSIRILYRVSAIKIRIHSRKGLAKVVARQKTGTGVFVNLRPWER